MQKSMFFVALLFIAINCVFASCLTTAEVAAQTETDSSAAATVKSTSGGTFTGRVTFSGAPVPARKIKITKDVPHCEHAGGEFQEVRVSDDGGLADVVIEIQTKQSGWTPDQPADGYVLRQKGCQFQPWLLVVPNGSNVKVFNDDEVTHNVNTGLWNEMQASGTGAVEKPITGRQGIRVSCNIHSWMEAWIYPVRSPHYAHTTADGKFVIGNIPAGKYRATAWHPTLGRKKMRLEFVDGETLTEEIVFEAP